MRRSARGPTGRSRSSTTARASARWPPLLAKGRGGPRRRHLSDHAHWPLRGAVFAPSSKKRTASPLGPPSSAHASSARCASRWRRTSSRPVRRGHAAIDSARSSTAAASRAASSRHEHAARHPAGRSDTRIGGHAAAARSSYLQENERPRRRHPDSVGWRARLVAFVRGASVLVHAAMYTAAEYPRRGGDTGGERWGFAHEAGVRASAVTIGRGAATRVEPC